MIMWEKWLELKSGSLSRARTNEPEVSTVQIKTRNWYRKANDGKANLSSFKLHQFCSFWLTNFLLYDLAYSLYARPSGRVSIRRFASSSQAAFECAQTRTHLLVVVTISAIAATKVCVLPVPIVKKLALIYLIELDYYLFTWWSE